MQSGRRLIGGVAVAGLLGCAAEPAAARPDAAAPFTDSLPAARIDAGPVRAEVAPGGDLRLVGPGAPSGVVDRGVSAELAVSPDGRWLVYARRTVGESTDLARVPLPAGAPVEAITDWDGSEDRPVFSPDGGQLAFVSGRTGIASLYRMPWPPGAGAAVQWTNVGLEDVPRVPGQPPPGFIPPPAAGVRWADDGRLHFEAEGRTWAVALP